MKLLGMDGRFWVANDYSRRCDLATKREDYVRLSFVPNSAFFQKRQFGKNLVWLRFPLEVLALGDVGFTSGNAASTYAFMCRRADCLFIGWDMVNQANGIISRDRGPNFYPNPTRFQFSRPAFNSWNSEILIENFVPIVFRDGVFDADSGDPIQEYCES